MWKFLNNPYLKIFIPIFMLLFFFLSYAVTTIKALPQGFTKTKVVAGFESSVDFAFLPDNRILVAEKGGSIKVIKNGSVLPTPMITLPVNSEGERGLLGIAVDPGFSTNNTIYVYYVNNSPLEIHVSKLIVSGDSAGAETVLLKSEQPLAMVHHSGTVRVGPDGKLWISVGNNEAATNPQDLSNIHGKILRINKDGSIPSDNPFVNNPSAKKEIWAYGLRNPFRFSFLPDGRPIIGDVGDAAFEEVNIGVKGGNFGYRGQNTDGPCSGCPYINPAYYYSHAGNTASITGGFKYAGNQFPANYQNSYFFADFEDGYIKRLNFDNGNITGDEMFDDNAQRIVSLLQGPDGALYYLTIFEPGFAPGALYKISYDSTNSAPTAKIAADKTSGNPPLNVNFSSNGSSDPESTPLIYAWDFGDGQTSTDANPSHTYNTKGVYSATLEVSDGKLKSEKISIKIAVGQSVPVVNITKPLATQKYNAGNTITYEATATDAEDGELAGDKFSWVVFLQHDEHFHPHMDAKTGKSGTFNIPDTGEASANTWYRIRLTVTDSSGLETVVTRDILPNKVTLNFATNPVGLDIKLDGIPAKAPITTQAVVGFKRFIDVDSPQPLNNKSYQFTSWSDSGTKQHQITTPSVNTTYTANFQEFEQGTGTITFRVRDFDSAGNWTGKFVNDATVKLMDVNGQTVLATKTSGKNAAGEDGWVSFNNIQTGNYGFAAYKNGYEGAWKQTTCGGAGTGTGATLQNGNTQSLIAAFTTATINNNQTTWCHDVGLKVNNIGKLYLRIINLVQNETGFAESGFLNGVTVKLTDTTGNTVIKTATSAKNSQGEDGWVFFNDITAGNYGLLGYKVGLEGEAKKVDCLGAYQYDSTINNAQTEGQKAAWNNNVSVPGGKTTYCADLALTEPKSTGHLKFRVREFEGDNWNGKFINDATVKLTDPSGATVYKTTTSKAFGNEDGWVDFSDIESRPYGVIVYKPSLQGAWKQLACDGTGTTVGVTLNNANTGGNNAAFNNSVSVKQNEVTWCKDMGLKTNVQTGSLKFRIREFANNTWNNNYINDVTVKLTDIAGNTVFSERKSSSVGAETGWVDFSNIPVGEYGIIAYKSGYDGKWKQIACDGSGTSDNVTIQNNNSENMKAVFDKAQIKNNEITWCHDLGLQKP